MPKDLSYRDPETILAAYEKFGSLRSTAKHFGTDHTVIATWLDRAKNYVPPQPPLVESTNKELRLQGDFLVISDWHLPLTKYGVLKRALQQALVSGITKVVAPGDLFNWDWWSDYAPKQSNAGPSIELEHGRYAVELILSKMDELVICLGNHDERITKKLNYGVSFDEAMRMCFSGVAQEKLDRIQITERDYVIVETPEGEWRICHTRSYSRMPLNYPNRLALRHNQHIAGGHRHHHAIGRAANGKWIVELGGLFDAENTDYLNRYTDDFPIWQNGYMLLVEGVPYCPMLSEPSLNK